MFTWEGTIKGPKDTMWEGEWCVTILGLLSIPSVISRKKYKHDRKSHVKDIPGVV